MAVFKDYRPKDLLMPPAEMKRIRAKMRWSQQELAYRLRRSKETIKRWEQPKRDSYNARPIPPEAAMILRWLDEGLYLPGISDYSPAEAEQEPEESAPGLEINFDAL